MPEFEPSDWKRTRIPKLSQLDSLQRCLICKDFLKAPVITSCNHTFCSQCIRQHLMSVSRCPLCKAEQFESNLKRVILLEEIVLCYQALRDDLIALMTPQEASVSENSPKEKPSLAIVPADVEVIEVSDEGLSTASKADKLKSGYVHCPVCDEVMKEEHVQGSHLDYCLNGKPDPKLEKMAPMQKRKAKDVTLFFQGQKRQRKAVSDIDHESFYFNQGNKHHHDTKKIPKVDFSSLSTAKVKEKLLSLKLPTIGSRAELEWRYNLYYLLHQSNLDSNHPQSELELRQKLKQWEISHLAAVSSAASNTIYGDSLSRKCISDKDFPAKAWVKLYKKEFKHLRRQALKSRNQKSSAKDENQAAERTDDLPDLKEVSGGGHLEVSLQNCSSEDGNNGESSEAPEPINTDFDFTNSILFTPN